MQINWHNIRPIHTSLNDGFEELVCQLASREIVTDGKHFQRIGKPDAGKECYWELTSGSLYMWQAKYFTSSLTTTQWKQINKSVINAIDAHANLSKYYVCLPLDMPDGKVKDSSSMLDKWKAKVMEWQKYATLKGVSVDFEYWGSAELISNLSKKENEGLLYFWFNKEEFSDEWISVKNNESINALGTRYTKELNYDLPIAKIFDGISRDKNFEKQIHAIYKAFLSKYRSIRLNVESIEVNKDLNSIKELIKEIRQVYEPVTFIGNEPIPLVKLENLLNACSENTSKIVENLYELRNAVEKEKGVKNHYSRPHTNDIGDLNSFISATYDFVRFIKGPTCTLANKPFLLITGDAGIGKSHLLADILGKRKQRKQNTLLLLGENFSNSDMPWTQILQNQLRKNQIDEFTFLGALNAKAESERSRTILMIDAINEGNGRKVWPKKLKSFIQIFDKFPWLGLVLSLRTSFEKLIAPKEELDKKIIVRVNHEGFAGVEYIVVKHFFNHYKIVQTSSPLLNPEFQNPLFLKLFCKSLADRGLNEVPPGYGGITSIIDYFLDSINHKLSLPEELDYDEKRSLVKLTVEKLLVKMVDEGKDHVEYICASDIADSVFKGPCGNTEPYLKRLISEGVLNEDLYWGDKGHYDVVYFAYQRFQDHLTVSLILDKCLDIKDPESSFQKGKLYDLVKNETTAYSNQNFIEALSIQLPERINKELFEVAPHAKTYHSIAEGFIQSLLWRKNDNIGENSGSYVNEIIIRDDDLFSQFLEVSILASMKVGFYFNADRLHAFLMRLTLPERDEIWTVWLQDKYDDDQNYASSVKRLIDFAWNRENDHHIIHDNSVLLGCITLGWLFTSTNRYLRDAATKGLVCFLQNRIHLIPNLLEKFNKVNDPYVSERLYASAYGAVMRTTQIDKLRLVSGYIYKEVFAQKEIYPHILLRDYARGIIEYAISVNQKPEVDIHRLRPPYKSASLPKKFPTSGAIDKKYSPKGKSGDYGGENWGATAILKSMTTEYGRGTARYGDFGRYTFQRGFHDWTVDVNGLSNYAIKLIFELGYDSKIFGEFDSRQGSGRGSGHNERIGKKYQWIVFYELLARVSDQCVLTDESSWDKPKKALAYNGPWHPYVRDIDPTILIKETLVEKFVDVHTEHWWFNQPYAPWKKDNTEWITDRKDIPAPEEILHVQDKNGDSWLWLEIHPEWGEEDPLGEDSWNSQKKRLWYQMRSYFIKKKDLSKFKSAFNRDFYRGDLPEARSLYTIFDREYYWSPAFSFFNKPYYSGKNWIEINDKKTDKKVTELHRTTEWFNWEEEFDCSKSSAIQYFKPTEMINRGLDLIYSDKEGELTDKNGEITCFDPSIHNNSISGLLVKKDKIISFLDKEGLVLIWSVIGEKQFLGNYRNRKGQPDRLNISGLYTLDRGAVKGKLNFEEE